MEVLLLIFCNKYFPATSEKYTDTFTSKQIQYIIQSHCGDSITQQFINEELQKKGYEYELLDNEFTWLCIKNEPVQNQVENKA